MSNFNATPFLSALLKDAIRDNEIGELQFNKDIISAYGILAGSIPLFDNAKSGTKANQFAIDPATLGGFMAKAKAGLGSNIKLAALPLDGKSTPVTVTLFEIPSEGWDEAGMTWNNTPADGEEVASFQVGSTDMGT